MSYHHARNSSPKVHVVRLCMILALLLAAVLLGQPVVAQEEPIITNQCFVVADEYFDSEGNLREGADTLAYLRLNTGDTQPVGGVIPNLNTTKIEAIAFKPNSADLYAVNGDTLGVLDLTAARFTPYTTTLGSSTVQTVTQEFNDVDGLSFDPLTGDLWGVNVNPSQLDVLFKIDTVTGQYVPDAFDDPNNPGNKVDYLTINSGSLVDDINDIAIDPVDGSIYGILTSKQGLASLVLLDPTNGNVTLIGAFTRESTGFPLQEMEGLGFAGDGVLYGSTGNDGNDANLFWRIDKSTGVATLIGQFDGRLVDIEALDCVSNAGFLVFESFINGEAADTVDEAVTLRVGDTITRTYLIRNTGAYPLSNVKVVDDNGTPTDTADDVTVCQDLSIPVGQSETCTTTESAKQGQQENIATVTAVDSLANPYNQQDSTFYIGYTGSAVGGRVWDDRNGNGIQDPAENNAAIDGVTVTLYDSTGTAITTTQTAEEGTYLFNNLQPGDYALGVQLPSGYDFTAKNQGEDDELDSDFEPDSASPNFGRTDVFTLIDGVIEQKWDAGLLGQVTTGTISGYVWNDLNRDGIQNDGEPSEVGLANITVLLQERTEVRSAQTLTTTQTSINGTYIFTDVVPGDYYVEFQAPEGFVFTLQNAGESELTDSDADPTNGRTGVFEVLAGTEQNNIDAGLRQERKIYLPTLRRDE